MLRKVRKTAKRKTARQDERQTLPDTVDEGLWDALRSLRRELAEIQSVAAYIIFHDATLMEMAQQRSQDREQFSAISGVGERKLEAYGVKFLALLRKYHADSVSGHADTN